MTAMRLLTTKSDKQVAINPEAVTVLLEVNEGIEVYLAGDPNGISVKGTVRDVASRLDISLFER